MIQLRQKELIQVRLFPSRDYRISSIRYIWKEWAKQALLGLYLWET